MTIAFLRARVSLRSQTGNALRDQPQESLIANAATTFFR
jgi:hypothetical protein